MGLWTLFFEFFRLSLLVIGGGYAILAVADAVFARRGWTREGEIVDQLPVFQSLPGLIATHTAVYVGRKVAGWRGAVVAVAAVALPSVAIFTLVAAGYRSIPTGNPLAESVFTGLRSALAGIILATLVRSARQNLTDAFSVSLAALGVVALGPLGLPAAPVMLAAMAAGLASVAASRTSGGGRVFQSSWLALLPFFKYGLLGFGGGFVLVPMYLQDFVGEGAAWLQLPQSEFAAVMALSQMTPGPIGVNAATFFGYRLWGVWGALAASAALLLPGSLLCYLALSSLDRFRTSRVVAGLMRGIRPASVALMLVAFVAFARMSAFDSAGGFRPEAAALVAFAAAATMRRWMGPMRVIGVCAACSAAVGLAARALGHWGG